MKQNVLAYFSIRWLLVGVFVSFCLLQSFLFLDRLRAPFYGVEYASSDERFGQMEWWDVHRVWARFLPVSGRMIAEPLSRQEQYYFPVLDDSVGRDQLDVVGVIRLRSYVFMPGSLLEAMPEKDVQALEPFSQSIRTKEALVQVDQTLSADLWNAAEPRFQEVFSWPDTLEVPVFELAEVVYYERRTFLMLMAYGLPVLIGLGVSLLGGLFDRWYGART